MTITFYFLNKIAKIYDIAASPSLCLSLFFCHLLLWEHVQKVCGINKTIHTRWRIISTNECMCIYRCSIYWRIKWKCKRNGDQKSDWEHNLAKIFFLWNCNAKEDKLEMNSNLVSVFGMRIAIHYKSKIVDECIVEKRTKIPLLNFPLIFQLKFCKITCTPGNMKRARLVVLLRKTWYWINFFVRYL